jgi:Dyp-type peroxidase family
VNGLFGQDEFTAWRHRVLHIALQFSLTCDGTVPTQDDVIRTAIEPFEVAGARRFFVQDTPIEIGPRAVLPITISLNELCTNAVKYGALSNPTGYVDITSAVDQRAQQFSLTWTEKGGPEVSEPTRHSFGTRLISRLADQLHGDVRLRYEPAGVVCELRVPLAVLRLLDIPALQEEIIGRTKIDNVELDDDAAPRKSHKTLTTITDSDGNELDILRDNMPFGRPGQKEFGTYFIGYSRYLWVIEQMLQRMYVGDPPGAYDRLLDFSTPQTGTTFFAPSRPTLQAQLQDAQGTPIAKASA